MNRSTLVSRLMLAAVLTLTLGAAVDTPKIGSGLDRSQPRSVQAVSPQAGSDNVSSRSGVGLTGDGLRAARGETFISCQTPDQSPHGGFAIVHSDVAFGSSAADSFTVTADLDIVKIRWWGAYRQTAVFQELTVFERLGSTPPRLCSLIPQFPG